MKRSAYGKLMEIPETVFLALRAQQIIMQLKPRFHIIAPVAAIAAVIEKRVSATVAIYGNTLFNHSRDGNDGSDWFPLTSFI